MRFSHVVCVALLSVLAAGLAAAAVTGQFLSMAVEVKTLWLWLPIAESSRATSYTSLTTSEALAYGDLLARCVAGPACPCSFAAALGTKATYASTVAPQIGKAYRVRLTNRTPCTISVVLGIDGMNTVDGQHVAGTSGDAKWVIGPLSSAVISGWQATEQSALEFYFTMPEDSASPYQPEVGEIRAYVFFERPPAGLTTLGLRTDVEVGTGAGSVVGQPTIEIPFDEATPYAAEALVIRYSETRPALGFTCGDASGLGVQVVALERGMPAEAAGLRVGDIITQVDGLIISSCSDISGILGARSPGDYMTFRVHRSSGVYLVTVRVGGV